MPGPPIPLLAEAERYVVVAKPPRMIVHHNAWTRGQLALVDALHDQLGRKVFPVHRLDYQTSGCLVFALDGPMAGLLNAALPTGKKRYLAMVRGYFRPDGPVLVDTPMKDDNGLLKEASSTVRALGRSHTPRCSLLLVEPHTGRIHQVRRHVRDLGHPVLGDHEHGDTRVNRQWREQHRLARLALHCLSLELALPDGGALSVRCPLFADHAALLSAMPWWDEAVSAEPALAAPPLPLYPSGPV